MWKLTCLALLLAALAYDYPRWLDRILIDPYPPPSPAKSAILITGTSSGLGRAASFYLANNGFTVLGTVRNEKDADELSNAWTEEAAKSQATGAIVPIEMDVTSDESVTAAQVSIYSLLKVRGLNLAAIVNNAGVGVQGPVLSRSGSASSYEWSFQVNVFGVVRVTQAFLPLMKQNGEGRLITVGSVAGVLCQENGAPYTATKHALEGMSDTWRRELSRSNLSVSLIQPGFIASNMCDSERCDISGLPKFSEAVLHAVSDEYPKTRYAVADVVVMPAWLAVWVDSILPDRVADWVIDQEIWVNWNKKNFLCQVRPEEGNPVTAKFVPIKNITNLNLLSSVVEAASKANDYTVFENEVILTLIRHKWETYVKS
ncbi:hypothetical protein TrLO_g10991 [Triparma laevis f. longispina]|uniref:NAD(P)-binding protein n=1 Tax=Triparma laevis f. longispina TaxID=1714387 RepID=A0A9W6ZHY8_9STRA|nr:hypothetical protein TrLO_g10991 [Triparma laevis f. longispina]